jgi:hypothetical protein
LIKGTKGNEKSDYSLQTKSIKQIDLDQTYSLRNSDNESEGLGSIEGSPKKSEV